MKARERSRRRPSPGSRGRVRGRSSRSRGGAARPRPPRTRARGRPWCRPRYAAAQAAGASTRAAVEAGTRKRSGWGRSPCSSDETPVWSTTGAIPTPRATRRVISSGVNGRPALGISALPGSRGVDVLILVDRALAVVVCVPDRTAVPPQVLVDRIRQAQRREPEAVAARSAIRGRPGHRRAARAARPGLRRARERSPSRSSMIQAPSGRRHGVERWTRDGRPSSRRPRSADGRVPDVLMTSRSAGSSSSGS